MYVQVSLSSDAVWCSRGLLFKVKFSSLETIRSICYHVDIISKIRRHVLIKVYKHVDMQTLAMIDTMMIP